MLPEEEFKKSLVSSWASHFRGWGYHGGITITDADQERMHGSWYTEKNSGPA